MYKSILLFSLILLFTSLKTEAEAQDKILLVITNNKEVKVTVAGSDTTIAGGYELSEVSEAYQVFTKSGFQVDFMSPAGGMTYPEKEEEMSELNKSFLNDPDIKNRLDNTFSPSEVSADDYVAIYFAGGKTLWDFPNNEELAVLIRKIYENDGIVGAVCHGPSALIGVTLSDGTSLIEGKRISGFTKMEEQLFSKAAKFYPFILQDELSRLGAEFAEAPAMFMQMASDSRIVTGQNPISTYPVAEEMVRLLDHTPPETPWSDLSYTLEIIKKVVKEDPDQARAFMIKHLNSNTVDEGLFLEYSSFGYAGHLGDEIQNNGIKLLKFASEAFPTNAKAYEELGKAYYKEGEIEKAKSALKESLTINEDSESAAALLKKIQRE